MYIIIYSYRQFDKAVYISMYIWLCMELHIAMDMYC